MKNKLLFMLMLVFIMIWSFISQVYAQEKSPSTKKKTSAQQVQALPKATGKVTNCDLKNSTVTIITNNGNLLVIKIDKSTAITKAGKNIKLADIKVGNVIAVSYETKKSTNIAKSIDAQEKTTSAASVPTKSKK